MKPSRLKQIVVLPILMMLLGLAGCNTVEGFGKDLQKVGDKIEKKAGEVIGPDESGDANDSSGSSN